MGRALQETRGLPLREPNPAPKNKNKGGRKTNGAPAQGPAGGRAISPPLQEESQPFSPTEKTNTAVEISSHRGPWKSIANWGFLLPARLLANPRLLQLLSPLLSKRSCMENLECGIFFRFQRSYCSTASCYFYLGLM